MLQLNKIQKTITGKTVKPFTVQDKIVYCFDNTGNVIHLSIDEFNFKPVKKKKTIYVNPIESKNSDELHTDFDINDGFFETEVEPTIIEKIVEVEKVVEKIVEVPVEKVIEVIKEPIVKTTAPVSSYIEDDDYI